MIEKIKTPLKRALRHPKEAGAILLSGVALTGQAVQPAIAQAERSPNQSTLLKLAKQGERDVTGGRPVEAATGTLTVSRRVHNAGPHHNKTMTVYDHISHPLVVQYRSSPQPIGFVPGPNQRDVANGDFAFGTMTIKDHKPKITFSPYDPKTMALGYPGTPTNEPDQGLITESIVFYRSGNSPYQDFNVALLAGPDGAAVGIAYEPDGQPQQIGHLTTTLHP